MGRASFDVRAVLKKIARSCFLGERMEVFLWV